MQPFSFCAHIQEFVFFVGLSLFVGYMFLVVGAPVVSGSDGWMCLVSSAQALAFFSKLAFAFCLLVFCFCWDWFSFEHAGRFTGVLG